MLGNLRRGLAAKLRSVKSGVFIAGIQTVLLKQGPTVHTVNAKRIHPTSPLLADLRPSDPTSPTPPGARSGSGNGISRHARQATHPIPLPTSSIDSVGAAVPESSSASPLR